MSNLLTSSRLKAARACQRLHDIQYRQGYRPVEDADALRFGTLIHVLLEAWWRASGTDDARLHAALVALRSTGQVDPFDWARAWTLIHGYHLRWKDEPYEAISVEVPFETELRNPATGYPSQTWKLAGKIDVIVRDLRDGRIYIIEHKTSSEQIGPGSEYWRRLRMDGQISIYYEGARSLGHDIAGCIYDVLGKPSIRPLKATPEEARKYTKAGALYANQRTSDETPEQFQARLTEDIAVDPNGYFQRGVVVRLENEMEEALFDVWNLGKLIREGEIANRAPRNPDSCNRYGRTCPYFSVCSGETSLENEQMYRKNDTVHPELENV